MTRMWANYGVQVPSGRCYLLCFPAFCFSGKGGATARRRKLKPDALDMRWIFLMLTVINSWNNRQGNLADPPRLELLIKARRTWRKANAGVAIPQFSLKSVEMETFLQEESEREPSLPLPLSAGCRGFPALVSSTLWEKSLQNAFYFQHAWGARHSSSWEAAWPGWCGRSEQRLEHPLLLWKFKAKRDSCASAFPGEMLWITNTRIACSLWWILKCWESDGIQIINHITDKHCMRWLLQQWWAANLRKKQGLGT